ncbi:MAG: hypothetical protein ABIP36_06700 [Acidimicrobiales bacterium]
MLRRAFGNIRAVNYPGRDMDTRAIAVIALVIAVIVLILVL